MNVSETVDRLLEMHQQGSSGDDRIAEYLRSMLSAGGAQVQTFSPFTTIESRSVLAGTVFLFSLIFLACVVRRRHAGAIASGLAIPVLLALELPLDIPVVSWLALKRPETLILEFPIQNAARSIILGTTYGSDPPVIAGVFAQTVSAFLLPITAVVAVLACWHLLLYVRKTESEDVRTIALVMGSVCFVYYGLFLGMNVHSSLAGRGNVGVDANTGSVAVLAALAEDLSQRYPRMQNTSVTLAFFGGGGGRGATALARKLARERRLPTYFLGCERFGRGGPHGYVIPTAGRVNPLYADRYLVRLIGRASIDVTGRQLGIVHGGTIVSEGFVTQNYPTATIATLPRESLTVSPGQGAAPELDRGQLLESLQVIERMLVEFDRPPWQ